MLREHWLHNDYCTTDDNRDIGCLKATDGKRWQESTRVLLAVHARIKYRLCGFITVSVRYNCLCDNF